MICETCPSPPHREKKNTPAALTSPSHPLPPTRHHSAASRESSAELIIARPADKVAAAPPAAPFRLPPHISNNTDVNYIFPPARITPYTHSAPFIHACALQSPRAFEFLSPHERAARGGAARQLELYREPKCRNGLSVISERTLKATPPPPPDLAAAAVGPIAGVYVCISAWQLFSHRAFHHRIAD